MLMMEVLQYLVEHLILICLQFLLEIITSMQLTHMEMVGMVIFLL